MTERTASLYIGDDQWHCTSFDLSDIDTREPDGCSLIRGVYAAWLAARKGATPNDADFMAPFLRGPHAGNVTPLEIASAGGNFLLTATGPTAQTRQPIDIKDPIQRRGLLLEILECVETRKPVYQEIRTCIHGVSDHHWRLMVPVGDAEHDVARIYVARRPASVSERKPVDFAALIP